jgi:hypothetical protein
MIDLRYHIASIVAVFLALGLGVLIGSTIVGDNLIVDQQKKMLDRLETQFYVLREQENILNEENQYQKKIIADYENYSQLLLPALLKERLTGYNVAIVVTGSQDIPAGMLNALSVAGVNVVSKTVVLANLSLDDPELCRKLIDFYGLDAGADRDSLRNHIAVSAASIIMNQGDAGALAFLQQNELVKFNGDNTIMPNGLIVLGGSNNLDTFFANSFDQSLIDFALNTGCKVFGVESSEVSYSYMENYQKKNISTVDDIDLSPGQISLVFAMEGEPGHYGIKSTAQKFMPSLPLESIKGN